MWELRHPGCLCRQMCVAAGPPTPGRPRERPAGAPAAAAGGACLALGQPRPLPSLPRPPSASRPAAAPAPAPALRTAPDAPGSAHGEPWGAPAAMSASSSSSSSAAPRRPGTWDWGARGRGAPLLPSVPPGTGAARAALPGVPGARLAAGPGSGQSSAARAPSCAPAAAGGEHHLSLRSGERLKGLAMCVFMWTRLPFVRVCIHCLPFLPLPIWTFQTYVPRGSSLEHQARSELDCWGSSAAGQPSTGHRKGRSDQR